MTYKFIQLLLLEILLEIWIKGYLSLKIDTQSGQYEFTSVLFSTALNISTKTRSFKNELRKLFPIRDN